MCLLAKKIGPWLKNRSIVQYVSLERDAHASNTASEIQNFKFRYLCICSVITTFCQALWGHFIIFIMKLLYFAWAVQTV